MLRILLLLLIAVQANAAVNWREGRQYQQGDVVTYHGKMYQARQSHTAERGANWNPESAASLWEVQNAKANRLGWQEGQTYRKGQITLYQGRNYRALQTHTAEKGANWNPRAAASLWEELDQR